MKPLLVLLALLTPSLAQAQLRLYQLPDGGTEQPAPGLLDLGTAYVGDTREARLRARNEGQAKLSIDKLFVAGTGFVLARDPTIPWVLAAGASVDFSVRFAPRQYGSYSASLTVNTLSILLVGRTPPTLSLLAGDQLLGAGTPLDFGDVAVGTSSTRSLMLRNDTAATIPLPQMKVLGDSFRGPDGLAGLTELRPASSATFTVMFTPNAVGAQEGWLVAGDRSYRLLGSGANPPFPKPTLLLDTTTLSSGGRARVLVRLGVEAPFSAGGTLQMELRPAAPGALDDTAQFLAGGRSIPVSVQQGQVAATADSEFQAGTTAGEIVFTVKLAGWTDTLHVPLNPQPVKVDTAKAFRSSSGVETDISGFDNTRSVSQLNFTFYLRDGSAHPSGPVSVAAGPDFTRYFTSSSLGGAFSLRVQFPVSGDASQLSGVEVEVVNTAGAAKTQRLAF